MDPSASGPDVHYYMIRGGSSKTNITVWETGTIGGEYVKTYGHYHVDDIRETYAILAGQGILLIQQREKDQNGKYIDDRIASFLALRVKAGDSIPIPPYSGHLLVNTGRTWLVTSDDSPFNADDSSGMPQHAEYETVRKMRGFAYYVVEKDGSPVLVKNNNYSSVPDAEISDSQ